MLSDDLFLVVDRLGDSVKEVKEEALNTIMPILLSRVGAYTVEQGSALGYEFYRSEIKSPAPMMAEVVWFGETRSEEGYRLGGGLFKEEAYKGGYKILTSISQVEGIDNTYLNARAEVYPISRDDLIDLLYDNMITNLEG